MYCSSVFIQDKKGMHYPERSAKYVIDYILNKKLMKCFKFLIYIINGFWFNSCSRNPVNSDFFEVPVKQ